MNEQNSATLKQSDVDLALLTNRLEMASGQNRDLDHAIAAAIGFFDRRATNLDADPALIELSVLPGSDGVRVKVGNEKGGGLIYTEALPSFTGSLDAALAALRHVTGTRDSDFALEYVSGDDKSATAYAGVHRGLAWTPELALCSAVIQMAKAGKLVKVS